MSTPKQAAPATDLDLALLLQGLMGPTLTPGMWSVSYDGPGSRIFTSPRSAAPFIVDEVRRRVKNRDAVPVSVLRLDAAMTLFWDASSDVADALDATGWPEKALDPSFLTGYRLRAEAINIIEAILVPED
jgi:hypothetical protein